MQPTGPQRLAQVAGQRRTLRRPHMATDGDAPARRRQLDQAPLAGGRRDAHLRSAEFQPFAPTGAFALDDQPTALQVHRFTVQRMPRMHQQRGADGQQLQPGTSGMPSAQKPTAIDSDSRHIAAYSPASWRGVTLQWRRSRQARAWSPT